MTGRDEPALRDREPRLLVRQEAFEQSAFDRLEVLRQAASAAAPPAGGAGAAFDRRQDWVRRQRRIAQGRALHVFARDLRRQLNEWGLWIHGSPPLWPFAHVVAADRTPWPTFWATSHCASRRAPRAR
eukprot:6833814-Pyramimonas_sp.AAC.1